MAQTLRSAIDGMVGQYLADPNLDLNPYGAELVTLFELATRKSKLSTPCGQTCAQVWTTTWPARPRSPSRGSDGSRSA
jgi:hypothetical protein